MPDYSKIFMTNYSWLFSFIPDLSEPFLIVTGLNTYEMMLDTYFPTDRGHMLIYK